MFNPCLLIPVYNHGEQLPATVAALQHFGLPCLLVNDGSDQSTYNTIESLCRSHNEIHAKHLPVNSGKGVAVLAGIEWARELGYSHALQIDADGQHDVNDISPMLDLAKKNPAALISGWPQYDDSVPRARLYGRYVTHVWVWIETLSLTIRDSMCGFRVYPVRETLATASHNRIGHRMDFDTDMMVRMYWDDIQVLFLPTRVIYPKDGVSHFAVWRDNLRISWMHTRLFLGMLPRFFHLLARKNDVKPWYQQPERGAYWGMRFSLWLYRVTGRRVMNVLLRFIVLYFFLFNRSARQASRDFLQRVYQDPRQTALLRKPGLADSYRHFYNFSDAIVDRIAAWSGDISVSEVDFPDREKLRNCSRGIVVLTSHLGNADMCRALCEHANGKKINVLLHTGGAPGMNRLLQAVNPKSQVELISVREVTPATAVLLQEKIEAGEWVVIAADRLPPDNPGRTESAMFLGRQAPFPQGAFILAALLQSPVYALFCLKKHAVTQESHFDIHVELLAETLPFARRQRQAVIAEVVKNYAALLEKYCLIAPFQWFNFHDFWKSIPPSNQDPSNPGSLNSDKEIL